MSTSSADAGGSDSADEDPDDESSSVEAARAEDQSAGGGPVSLALDASGREFAAVYDNNRERLLAIARSKLSVAGRRADAEDAVHEGLYSLMQTPPSAPGSWLALMVQAVSLRAIDIARLAEHRHSGPGFVELSEQPHQPTEEDVAADVVAADERLRLKHVVRDALADLPEVERNVIVAVFFGEQLQTEVAKDLGLSKGRVTQIKKSALAKLGTALAAEGWAREQ